MKVIFYLDEYINKSFNLLKLFSFINSKILQSLKSISPSISTLSMLRLFLRIRNAISTGTFMTLNSLRSSKSGTFMFFTQIFSSVSSESSISKLQFSSKKDFNLLKIYNRLIFWRSIDSNLQFFVMDIMSSRKISSTWQRCNNSSLSPITSNKCESPELWKLPPQVSKCLKWQKSAS